MSDSDYADVLVKDLEDFVNKYNDKIQPCVEDVSLIKECKDLLLNNHNIILHGAPATGKTFLAKEIASWIVFKKAYKDLSEDEKVELKKQMGFVQFHQSYDYTDFVEGLRPAKVLWHFSTELGNSIFHFCGIPHFCKVDLNLKAVFI